MKAGLDDLRSSGILGPVYESDKIAVIEITKTLHFVYRRNRISQTRHHLG